ncbi:MAG: anaerobic ribonucleoside triphosphate reductase [Cytophagales bacterium]|jgi:ribonucleoside-triphosphate reductase|nr:anaerobic ribonucleoside triphosphate reductase [Cytophagales bacterium]
MKNKFANEEKSLVLVDNIWEIFFDQNKGNKKFKKDEKNSTENLNQDKYPKILEGLYRSLREIVKIKCFEITKENANMNSETPSGMMMKFASELSKSYIDNNILVKDKEVEFVSDNNLLHIHDKDYYVTKSLNCMQYPLDKILKSGFSVFYSDNRPAKRIESACMLTCILFEAVQNEMFGGQSIPAFDFYLAPYVRMTYIEEIQNFEKILNKDLRLLYDDKIKDYITENEVDHDLENPQFIKQFAINRTVRRVYQAMEGLIHNLNTIHSRGGNQVVFSSINYGTDTSAEGRCIMRELLNSTYKGVGSGATAIFPIQIWKKKGGINFLPEDPNYDLFQLACKVTAKRFYPNFINLDAPFNSHEKWNAEDPQKFNYEVATMGCRTRIFDNRFGEKTSIARGNLSFSTINIVKIALKCLKIEDPEKKIKTFFAELDNIMEISVRQLLIRCHYQKTAKAKQFPVLMKYIWPECETLQSPEQEIGDIIKHGTLSLGFIGLAECLIALTGKHHGECSKAQELGLKIVSFMRDKIWEFSDRYDYNFSLIATPAEGLSGKFVKKDKMDFGVIEGITDKDYYTNSNHVPVYYHCSPKHKAEVEAPYHALTLGGHIFYVEIDGDATKNVQAIMDIVRLMDKNNVGYGAINHNRNHCLNCSYEDATVGLEKCPNCGSRDIDTIQRITGYLVGTTNKWNNAKYKELKDRVIHK